MPKTKITVGVRADAKYELYKTKYILVAGC